MEQKDVIIKTLALRIGELEKSLEEMEETKKERTYIVNNFKRDYYKHLRSAFASQSKDFADVKQGNVIRDSSTIYLVRKCEITFDEDDACKRIFGYASASVFEFPEDEVQLHLDIERFDGTCEINDRMENIFPASDHDIMILDFLLKERGYRRTPNGNLEKISE